MMDMYIKVSTEYDPYQDEDGYQIELEQMKVEKLALSDLIGSLSEDELNKFNLIRVDQTKPFGPKTKTILKKNGWVHRESAMSREDKKKLLQDYFVLRFENYYGGYKMLGEPSDLDNLSIGEISDLAQEKRAKIVQLVDPMSVLPEKTKSKIREKKKEFAEIEAKKIEKKLANAQKIADKKLAKAKAVIAELESKAKSFGCDQ